MHRISAPAHIVLALLCAPLIGCGGGESSESIAGSDSSNASASGGWSGLWIDDEGEHVQFAPDGRFASFSLTDAIQNLRFHEFGENEYGERTIPTLHRSAGWEVEGEKLVSYKRPADPARKDERIAGHTFRRLTADEELAYWSASAHRLVREGRLDEILEAEASGFDFGKITDSAFTQAAEGEDVAVDMLAYAVGHGHSDIADHFMELGHKWRRPWTRGEVDPVAKAVATNDPEYLARLCDHGLPLDTALREAVYKDAGPATFTVLFDKQAEPTQALFDVIDAAMPTNGAAVKPMFAERLGR